MNITFADFNRAATLAMQTQGLSGEDSVIHMRQDDASVNAMGRTWRPWGSSGRTADFKAANRATRQELLNALSGELNIDFTKVKEIPASLLKALNLDKFSLDRNGLVQSNKPLTARRITLISRAVDEIKAERARNAHAALNTSAFNAVKSGLDTLMAQHPGRFRTISDNAAHYISKRIAKEIESGTGVEGITDSVVRALKKNAASYGSYGLDQAFPALKDENFEGLTDQVRDFVTTVVGNLPNGVPARAPEEAHVFNFQSERQAAAPAPQPQPVIQPHVEAQRVVSNVTVKMGAEDFFTMMQSRAEEARKRPGVGQARFRPNQRDSTQFLNWITGLAMGRNSGGKTVRNADELTDKVLRRMQDRNSSALSCPDDILFPGVRKAVKLANEGTSSAEAWKDIRADVAHVIAQLFDFKG